MVNPSLKYFAHRTLRNGFKSSEFQPGTTELKPIVKTPMVSPIYKSPTSTPPPPRPAGLPAYVPVPPTAAELEERERRKRRRIESDIVLKDTIAWIKERRALFNPRAIGDFEILTEAMHRADWHRESFSYHPSYIEHVESLARRWDQDLFNTFRRWVEQRPDVVAVKRELEEQAQLAHLASERLIASQEAEELALLQAIEADPRAGRW